MTCWTAGLSVKLKRYYSRFAALTLDDRVLVVRIWLDAVWVKLLLRTPWRQLLLQPPPGIKLREDGPAGSEIRHLAELVDLSFTLLPATCLERAFVLQRLLRRHGVATTLRIGVRMDGDLLEAHAWLDHPALPLDAQQHEFQSLFAGTVDAGSSRWL